MAVVQRLTYRQTQLKAVCSNLQNGLVGFSTLLLSTLVASQ